MVQDFRERVKATESRLKDVISGQDRFAYDSSSNMRSNSKFNLGNR